MPFPFVLCRARRVRAGLAGCAAVPLLAALSPAALADTAGSATLAPVQVTSDVVADNNAYIAADAPASTSKLAVPVARTPFAISVVNREFIEDTGASSIQEALTYTSGVYAGTFGFDTRGDSAKVRGLNPSFYLDGLRSLYGSYNNVRPEMFALERVEVLKGPSSTLYGQAELGGIVNAVSKRPKAVRQGELWAQVGSYDRKQFAADITGPLSEDGKLLYRVVALKRDSGTQVDHVENNGFLFAPSLTWLPTDDTAITLLFTSQENDGGISAQFLPSVGTLYSGPLGHISSDTYIGEPGWDRYDRKKNEITLFVDHQINAGWAVALTSRYTRSSTETREHWTAIGMVPDASGNMPRVVYMDDRETRVINTDARLTGHLVLGPTRHTLALGVDNQYATWRQGNRYSGPGTPINVYNPVYGNMDYSSLNPQDADDNRLRQTGVYVIDHVEIGRVVVSGALRHDRTTSETLAVSGPNSSQDDQATTGRLGLMYRFDFGLSPYISYSEAFVPNLGTNSTGESLDPTTGEQKEVGVKYLSPARDFAVNAAWFDIEQQNQVFTSPTSPMTTTQTGAVVTGWELSVKKQLGRLSLLASYTHLDATNDQTGLRLPYVAEKVASGWARYRLDNGLRFGGGVRYLGDNVGAGGGPVVPSVTLFDAMVGYATGPWDFSLNARNVTDEEYVSWCRGAGYDCGYGTRRTVSANARYRFF